MARSKTKTRLQIEHFPEKLALGLDPRVAPVFRKKMRRNKKLERFPIPSNWKSALVAVGAAALIGLTAAQAQMRGNFDDADANHDGRVTLEEFRTYATNRLMTANGLIAQKFKGLSPQDQAARLQQRFETLDRGGKGYLDRSDWSGT